MSNQFSGFRSHMFLLGQSELEMHENLIACIIFCKEGVVKVGNEENHVAGKIICIKPNIRHWVSIPESGAEILYLDGTQFHQRFADFEVLNDEWGYIPDAFYNAQHNLLQEFRVYLDRSREKPSESILEVIEELYANPLNRMTQDDLAQHLGLERTLALRYFKSATGQTFRRFKKWAASVSVTVSVFNGQTIGIAGFDAGFADPAHTSRTAKELFGLTPTLGVSSLLKVTTIPDVKI